MRAWVGGMFEVIFNALLSTTEFYSELINHNGWIGIHIQTRPLPSPLLTPDLHDLWLILEDLQRKQDVVLLVCLTIACAF